MESFSDTTLGTAGATGTRTATTTTAVTASYITLALRPAITVGTTILGCWTGE